MLDDDVLRLLIEAKLADGRLPRERGDRVWGGRGSGETCTVCEDSVSKDQLVMESFGPKGDGLFFHLKCFKIWDHERLTPG